MTECYIYALDVKNSSIVAALPSEDIIAADSACKETTSRLNESGIEHGTFRFGTVSLSQARLIIGAQWAFEIACFDGKRPKRLDVPVGEFEKVALHTKDMLSRIQSLDHVPVEILFMQLAEAILPTIQIFVLPHPFVTHAPDSTDTFNAPVVSGIICLTIFLRKTLSIITSRSGKKTVR